MILTEGLLKFWEVFLREKRSNILKNTYILIFEFCIYAWARLIFTNFWGTLLMYWKHNFVSYSSSSFNKHGINWKFSSTKWILEQIESAAVALYFMDFVFYFIRFEARFLKFQLHFFIWNTFPLLLLLFLYIFHENHVISLAFALRGITKHIIKCIHSNIQFLLRCNYILDIWRWDEKHSCRNCCSFEENSLSGSSCC